jgi:carboxyl-terminal processing protease
VQNLYSLDQYIKPEGDKGYGQLTMTIGKYYRVTGESTQHRGVEPDVPLPSSIDVEQFGESVRDSALPWDTVDTTRFRRGEPLDDTIEDLIVSHDQRSKDDPNFQYLVDGIREIEEARSKDTISLNIDNRIAEREAERERALQRENDRRAALGLEPLESLEDIDEEDRPDILLEQAAQIASDLAKKRQAPPSPAKAARVSR